MRNTCVILTGLILSLFNLKLNAQHTLEEIWHTDSVFKFSEGVIPSQNGKLLYVSNTIGSPMARDGQGSISTVDLNGKLINADWVTGMNAPKDIQRFNNLIYAADLDEVVVINATSAKIEARIKIEGAQLLHNIAIDEKGIVYVSDLFAGKVYRIENGKSSVFLENLGYSAGLFWYKQFLYILTGGSLIKADKDKKITTIASGMDRNMNGLQVISEKEFLATNWSGIFYYINADGSNQVLLDNRSKQIPCGIIYYNPKTKIVYMTSDQHNVLYAYTFR